MSPHASNTQMQFLGTLPLSQLKHCLLCGGQLSPAVQVPGSNCRAYLLTRLPSKVTDQKVLQPRVWSQAHLSHMEIRMLALCNYHGKQD